MSLFLNIKYLIYDFLKLSHVSKKSLQKRKLINYSLIALIFALLQTIPIPESILRLFTFRLIHKKSTKMSERVFRKLRGGEVDVM